MGMEGLGMDAPGSWVKALLLDGVRPDSKDIASEAEAEEEADTALGGDSDVGSDAGEAEAMASEAEAEAKETDEAKVSATEAKVSAAVATEDSGRKMSYARRGLRDQDVMEMAWKEESYPYLELDFSQNDITAEGLGKILDLSVRCKGLKVLKLFKNRIADDCVLEVGELLERCVELRELHLSHNRFTSKGVTDIVVAANRFRSESMPPLWLRLENNDLSDPKALLRNLEDQHKVCPRKPRCSQFHCCQGSKVHLPLTNFRSEANVAALKMAPRSPPRRRSPLTRGLALVAAADVPTRTSRGSRRSGRTCSPERTRLTRRHESPPPRHSRGGSISPRQRHGDGGRRSEGQTLLTLIPPPPQRHERGLGLRSRSRSTRARRRNTEGAVRRPSRIVARHARRHGERSRSQRRHQRSASLVRTRHAKSSRHRGGDGPHARGSPSLSPERPPVPPASREDDFQERLDRLLGRL